MSLFNALPRLAEQLQIGAQLSGNYPANPGEKAIFATSVGPQEALTVAKITSAFRTEVSGRIDLFRNYQP